MEDAPAEAQLDGLEATVGEMARRFFPSDAVFPMSKGFATRPGRGPMN